MKKITFGVTMFLLLTVLLSACVKNNTNNTEIQTKNDISVEEEKSISKENISSDGTLTNLLNGDFSEFSGSYVATKESIDAMGGGQELNDLILKNDGSLSGGSSHYSKEFYPQTKPTSISKNADGSYTCKFTENSYYTIYPKGIIEDREYVKENQLYLKDTVYINCIVVDGGVLNATYYLETNSNTTEKTVKYDGVDWVSLDSFTQEVGGVFESGTGVKYTVTGIEENKSGRLTVFFTSQDGKKRKVSNIPAFLIDNGIMYYNIYEQ